MQHKSINTLHFQGQGFGIFQVLVVATIDIDSTSA